MRSRLGFSRKTTNNFIDEETAVANYQDEFINEKCGRIDVEYVKDTLGQEPLEDSHDLWAPEARVSMCKTIMSNVAVLEDMTVHL